MGPAGEWLLDNLHVVQEHIREVRESLPRGYYRELPELAGGALAGYPRVYEIAITLISHSEARIELENVDLFLSAFQQVRAAGDRRAVGHPRHAPARPDRECPAHGAPHGAPARGAGSGGPLGRPAGGRGRRERRGHRRRAQRLHQLSADPHPGLRLPLPRPAPRLRRRPPRAGPAGALDRGARDVGRGGRGPRQRTGSADPAHDGEQHHQPAGHRPHGLGGVRRASEHDRGDAPAGSGGRVRPDDLRDPGPVPARRRADRAAKSPGRGGRGAATPSTWLELLHPMASARPTAGGTSATTWWTTACPCSSGRRATARRCASGCTAGRCATRTWCSSAAWSPERWPRSWPSSGLAGPRPGPSGRSCCSSPLSRPTTSPCRR